MLPCMKYCMTSLFPQHCDTAFSKFCSDAYADDMPIGQIYTFSKTLNAFKKRKLFLGCKAVHLKRKLLNQKLFNMAREVCCFLVMATARLLGSADHRGWLGCDCSLRCHPPLRTQLNIFLKSSEMTIKMSC